MRSRTVALGVAGGAAAGVAIALARLGRPAAQRWRERGDGTGRQDAAPPYRCECGEQFRVAGVGRHRVYWPADAPEGDPVLSGHCPSCQRALPRDEPARTT